MKIELVYALPAHQTLMALDVPAGCTVAEAIQRSGICQRYPEIDLEHCPVGIFSQRVALSEPLKVGDRIEIYRPLTIDPKQARRLRQGDKNS